MLKVAVGNFDYINGVSLIEQMHLTGPSPLLYAVLLLAASVNSCGTTGRSQRSFIFSQIIRVTIITNM